MSNSEPVNDEIDELREYIKGGYIGALETPPHTVTQASAVAFTNYVILRMQSIITSQTKKAELKGRIDEIKYLADEDLIYIDLDSRYISERLAELKSELEGK